MLVLNEAISSFSVNSLEEARNFYRNTLGLKVSDAEMPGILKIQIGANTILIYAKPDHVPATFTVLNFPVKEIEATVKDLRQVGIKFEIYNLPQIKTDENGILTDGNHKIAWFKDPAGNILSILNQ